MRIKFLGNFSSLFHTHVSLSRCCCRVFRARRRWSEIPNFAEQKRLHLRLVDETVGEEPFMPTDKLPMPVVVSVACALAYYGIGVAVFANLEGWGTADAAYFTFVTLSTIGIGDMTPDKTFSEGGQTSAGMFRIAAVVIYIVVGTCVRTETANKHIKRALVSPNFQTRDDSDCHGLLHDQRVRSLQDRAGLREEVLRGQALHQLRRHQRPDQRQALLRRVGPEEVQEGQEEDGQEQEQVNT